MIRGSLSYCRRGLFSQFCAKIVQTTEIFNALRDISRREHGMEDCEMIFFEKLLPLTVYITPHKLFSIRMLAKKYRCKIWRLENL